MDFEKLGMFYLGRRLDPDTRDTARLPVLYDSSDLVTHAVIVGMTGSGKTGLGMCLMEEAAIDGIPVLAIDPKGDLPNLLLTFPSLSGAELAPWVNVDEARRAGQDVATFAAAEADRWKRGLAGWDQDGSRIERLRRSAEFAVYTPGSSAGRPISIVHSFRAPDPSLVADSELLSDRVNTAATSLLTLAGVDAQPMRSREHLLLATLLEDAWRRGLDLDVAALIGLVQTPSVSRIGVMDLEAFYPAADRFTLAMRLNQLLAAPGFNLWLQGEALDVSRLLYTAAGLPRVSVISIAHLDDRERMFFVSLLLNEVVGWMRMQRGTSSLRALLYFDEIVGFLPPVADPPSKTPLMRLLKQARAFGVGCALATQNPVDLDYKALSNAGTWMLGRLQTERDKARVLDGLQGVTTDGGPNDLDRTRLDALLSGLKQREFLLHNVHEREPLVFETRWALSYLRGPMSRDEIRRLSPPSVPAATPLAGAPAAPTPAVPAEAPSASRPAAVPTTPPVLPFPQYFVAGVGALWQPALVGVLRLQYSDAKLGIDETRDVVVQTPLTDGPVPADWEQATPAPFTAAELQEAPDDPGRPFAPLPPKATQARSYAAWAKDLARWAAQSQALELRRSSRAKLTSGADESEREFRMRVQMASREARDAAVEKVRQKYRARLESAEARLRRAEQATQKEAQQASDSKVQAGVSVAATIFGALLGRKAVSASTLGRATSAARGMSRVGREASDVARAETDLARAREQRDALAAEVEAAMQAVAEQWDRDQDAIETVLIKPKRGGVSVQLLALVWLPR